MPFHVVGTFNHEGTKTKSMGLKSRGSSCPDELPKVLLHSGCGEICDEEGCFGPQWAKQRLTELESGQHSPQHGFCPLCGLVRLNQLLQHKWIADGHLGLRSANSDLPQFPDFNWDEKTQRHPPPLSHEPPFSHAPCLPCFPHAPLCPLPFLPYPPQSHMAPPFSCTPSSSNCALHL